MSATLDFEALETAMDKLRLSYTTTTAATLSPRESVALVQSFVSLSVTLDPQLREIALGMATAVAEAAEALRIAVDEAKSRADLDG